MTTMPMPMPWHALKPFEPAAGPLRSLDAAASLLHRPGETPLLQLCYRLKGLQRLRLPAPSRPAARLDELWQHTCFEAFVGCPDQQDYWEFNLSPSGDWAAYRFLAYRQGQQQELSYAALPVELHPHDLTPAAVADARADLQTLELSCCFALPPALAGASQLQLGLTAVLETDLPQPDLPQTDLAQPDLADSPGGGLSYWALKHPATQADFHDRRGWTVLLRLEPTG